MTDVLHADTKPSAEMLQYYGTVVASIRATDDISFKLLNAVPLFAGVGSSALAVLEKGGHIPDPIAAITLSLTGCVFTAGLFRWEIRNIQKCDWFISRAARLERQMFPGDSSSHQFTGLTTHRNIDAERIDDIHVASMWHGPWGKTRAEKLIYWTAIFSWLIPAAIGIASVMEKVARVR